MDTKFDPDDWPKPQKCNDRFEQEGKASKKVKNCNSWPPEVEIALATEAQADAKKKADLRCSHKCPTEFVEWHKSRKTCVDNTLTVYVTGKFVCKNKPKK